jgi:phage gp29-like protein
MPKWYQFWKDEKETTKPEGGIFVSGVRRDYDSSVSQVTPESLAAILRGAASGSIRQQMDLFTLIEEDPHIKSVLNKRRLNVCSKKMAIAPYDEEKISQQACDICNEIVFGIGSMGGIGNLKEAIFNSTDAIGKGFAINQIVWQLLDGKWRIPKLAWWPQSECAVGNPSKLYDQDSDKIFILTDVNRVTGEELQQYQWMVHTYKSASTPLAKAGLLRSVAWFYLFKRFASRHMVCLAGWANTIAHQRAKKRRRYLRRRKRSAKMAQ